MKKRPLNRKPMNNAVDTLNCLDLYIPYFRLFLQGPLSVCSKILKHAGDFFPLLASLLHNIAVFDCSVAMSSQKNVQLHLNILAVEKHFVSMGKSLESTMWPFSPLMRLKKTPRSDMLDTLWMECDDKKFMAVNCKLSLGA